jgi:glycosyltransferase involved in cell wall biosynthesis
MKIGVIGARGFPDVMGGIETHCFELYTRIARIGDHQITVYRRKPYLNSKNRNVKYKNIRFIDFYVPRTKFFETFLHSFLSTVHALFQSYDIVHYHNTGPGFFIPILKLSKAKIVFTYHNISYTQKKWNSFAKNFLALSERVSIKNSDFIIFISEIIKSEIVKKYIIRKYCLIFNGVTLPNKTDQTDYLTQLGLERQKYVLAVGRFIEEKGFDYLIKAFKKARISDYKLVIVGDMDYPTEYSNRLKLFAKENDVVLTGFIKGEKLNQVYSSARLLIMPSYEEGLPIVLLEALSYDIDVLVSDIPANLQIGLDHDDYFKVGDKDDLVKKMLEKLSSAKVRSFREILSVKFNWDKIALETNNIYKNLTI